MSKNKKILIISFVVIVIVIFVFLVIKLINSKHCNKNLVEETQYSSNSEEGNNIRYMNAISGFFIGDSFITVPFIIQDVNKTDFQIKYLDTTNSNNQKYQKYIVKYDDNKRLIKIERYLKDIRKGEFIKIEYKKDNKEEIDKIQMLDDKSKVTATYIPSYNDQKKIIYIEKAILGDDKSEKIYMNYYQNMLLKTVKKIKRLGELEIEKEFKMNYNSNNKLIKIEECRKKDLSEGDNNLNYNLDYNEDKLTKIKVLEANKPINNFEINIS